MASYCRSRKENKAYDQVDCLVDVMFSHATINRLSTDGDKSAFTGDTKKCEGFDAVEV
jgi:hypothetical protein